MREPATISGPKGAPSAPPKASGAPINEALAVELERFEMYSLRLWQLVTVIGMGLGLVMTAMVPGYVGPAIFGVASLYLAYTFPIGYLNQKHGRLAGGRLLSVTIVESSVPWTFLLVLNFAQGAEYALASWIPPLLFGMTLFQSALRLRANTVFVVGYSGSFAFLLIWFFVVRSGVPDSAAHLLYAAPLQVSRFILILTITTVCGFGARFLRSAIVRAEMVTRSKDLFGKYRLQGLVARGGMGEVIEALYCPEGGFERRVAIKRIHKHLADQSRFVDQFRTEAELCSRLAHPNVVQVMDFGKIEETYFLAMEFVDGMTLAQLLRQCDRQQVPLPEHVVGVIMRDVLDGLDHAHRVARGAGGQPLHVVHRDLCPQNILLSNNGEVKITDFGVARALKDAESSETRTVVGHTAYLAPEQARAKSIDARIDLFAAGVIAWELLTARRLFRRDTDSATVLALLNDPVPPLAKYRDGLHPDWDTFLKTALEREPSQRFQSAREMAAALDDIPTSRQEGARRQLASLLDLLTAGADPPGDDDPGGPMAETLVEKK